MKAIPSHALIGYLSLSRQSGSHFQRLNQSFSQHYSPIQPISNPHRNPHARYPAKYCLASEKTQVSDSFFAQTPSKLPSNADTDHAFPKSQSETHAKQLCHRRLIALSASWGSHCHHAQRHQRRHGSNHHRLDLPPTSPRDQSPRTPVVYQRIRSNIRRYPWRDYLRFIKNLELQVSTHRHPRRHLCHIPLHGFSHQRARSIRRTLRGLQQYIHLRRPLFHRKNIHPNTQRHQTGRNRDRGLRPSDHPIRSLGISNEPKPQPQNLRLSRCPVWNVRSTRWISTNHLHEARARGRALARNIRSRRWVACTQCKETSPDL